MSSAELVCIFGVRALRAIRDRRGLKRLLDGSRADARHADRLQDNSMSRSLSVSVCLDETVRLRSHAKQAELEKKNLLREKEL